MIPDPVDRAVELCAAGEIGERTVELARRQVAMAAPAEQQRVVRRDREAPRERRDRFAILPHARLRDAERDDAVDVARISSERALGARDRAGVALRAVFHASR